ncbi:hypothetical protein [Oceanimonas smirnovii]|uniref:hypothetical protein n=1 Tax=Oceanimonas smirnovii TaxID=264574 RepID=UPI0012EA598D|nr:hypothetical protein [Oceanimonas smirnovii]
MKKVNLDSVNHQNKISIFIGENGDEKSSALHQIAEFHISKGTNVIAISNCLHDKFMPTSKKLHYTSAKYGSTTYNEVLCGLLRKMDIECIAPLSRTLQYCGYLNKVGINIS